MTTAARAALVLIPLCCLRAQSPEEHFRRGLRLLHSFEYDDARQEFVAAQKLAPGFAMAIWGEAMTYNEPLWQAQNPAAARAVLQRPVKAPTGREQDYLGAVAILFGRGGKEQRDIAYAEAMRRVFEKYPQDIDAAAFYALALLGTCAKGRDFRVYMKAAAILEEELRKHPEHPGALHYLIHCYDDPIHAPLGLRAARIYAKVAPESAHALHMPSHIFIAMGMWDEVVASNEASWAASHSGSYHSLWWLAYGYLQQGRFEDARRFLKTMEQIAKSNAAPLVRFHLAMMLAAFRIETGEPYAIAGGLKISDLGPPAIAADLLGAGLLAANRGALAEAERCLEALRRIEAPVAEKELSAVLLMADGKSKEALAAMAEAVKAEDAMSLEFGPPVPPKPAHELYGEILLQLGRADQAREQFELALARAPKRALSLLGLARSLSQSGNQAQAKQVYAELANIWHRADPPLRKALGQ